MTLKIIDWKINWGQSYCQDVLSFIRQRKYSKIARFYILNFAISIYGFMGNRLIRRLQLVDKNSKKNIWQGKQMEQVLCLINNQVRQFQLPNYTTKLYSQQKMDNQPLVSQLPTKETVYLSLQQEKTDVTKPVTDGITAQARSAYIVKVYAFLILELAITFGVCLLSQYCLPFRQFQLRYQWVVIFPALLLCGTVGIAICVPAARKFPFDLGLLLLFILSFAYMISYSCSIVANQVPGPSVVIAIGSTVLIVLTLTIYALFCRANFAIMIGVIIVVSQTMTIVLILALVTFAPVMISIYCGLAVIIYGIYLVIITKVIISGELGQLFPMDSYIVSSLFMYIYILMIFALILKIVDLFKK